MESMEWYGIVHGVHMEHSIGIPWSFHTIPYIPWSKSPFYHSLYTIPYGIHGIHPFHMDSIWKPSGSGKYRLVLVSETGWGVWVCELIGAPSKYWCSLQVGLQVLWSIGFLWWFTKPPPCVDNFRHFWQKCGHNWEIKVNGETTSCSKYLPLSIHPIDSVSMLEAYTEWSNPTHLSFCPGLFP